MYTQIASRANATTASRHCRVRSAPQSSPLNKIHNFWKPTNQHGCSHKASLEDSIQLVRTPVDDVQWTLLCRIWRTVDVFWRHLHSSPTHILLVHAVWHFCIMSTFCVFEPPQPPFKFYLIQQKYVKIWSQFNHWTVICGQIVSFHWWLKTLTHSTPESLSGRARNLQISVKCGTTVIVVPTVERLNCTEVCYIL